jgi:hypothetical protein
MRDEQHEHRVVADDGRRLGAGIGEQILEIYGVHIGDDEVEALAADLTGEIFQRTHALWTEGLPAELAILWGHECVNGLQDRILEHASCLRFAAALVGVDPARAIWPQCQSTETSTAQAIKRQVV